MGLPTLSAANREGDDDCAAIRAASMAPRPILVAAARACHSCPMIPAATPAGMEAPTPYAPPVELRAALIAWRLSPVAAWIAVAWLPVIPEAKPASRLAPIPVAVVI